MKLKCAIYRVLANLAPVLRLLRLSKERHGEGRRNGEPADKKGGFLTEYGLRGYAFDIYHSGGKGRILVVCDCAFMLPPRKLVEENEGFPPVGFSLSCYLVDISCGLCKVFSALVCILRAS